MGESQGFPLSENFEFEKQANNFVWDISLYDTVEEKVIKEYTNVTELFNLNRYDVFPNFTGKATYSTNFDLKESSKKVLLRVYAEGQTVELSVNGNPAELQICNPFIFDITDYVQEGKNSLSIGLCNTLANRIDEKYTAYLPVYPGGMIVAPEIYLSK